jgi:hypothetical protein
MNGLISNRRNRRTSSFRLAGWLTIVAMLALALLGPAASRVLGAEGDNPPPSTDLPGVVINNKDNGHIPIDTACVGGALTGTVELLNTTGDSVSGSVTFYLTYHTPGASDFLMVGGSNATETFAISLAAGETTNVTFSLSGTFPADTNTLRVGSTLASDNAKSASIPPCQSQPSSSPSPSASPSASPSPSPSPSASPSPSPSPSPSASPGGSVEASTGASASPSASVAASVAASTGAIGGGVLGATGTPGITPPNTATGGNLSSPGSDSWRLVLIAMAVVLSLVLILTPSPDPRRR